MAMPQQFSWRPLGVAIGLLALVHAGTVRADVSSQQVISAIRKGVHYLLKHQKRPKPWEEADLTIEGNGEKGGESALVLESLLTVGQSLHMRNLNIFRPPMRRAIAYVANVRSPDTYVISLQANAMALLPPKAAYIKVLKKDRSFLRDSLFPQGAYGYSWRANGSNSHRHWDNSNSQYGVLGMWAVAHSGLLVQTSYWHRVRRHWESCQYASGSWGYWQHLHAPAPDVDSSRPHAMTSAGLASLFICDEFLQSGGGAALSPDPAIVRGLGWINRHFNSTTGNMYTLYGYVRTGLACGLQNFRDQNWYQKIAADVLANQHSNGSWSSDIHHPRIDSRIVGTAYALLILARGLNPVVFNKLDYGTRYYGQWNAYPRDDANVTSWMTRNFETPLNWQVVSLRSPVRAWLDSPLLLITGHKDPHFTAGDIAKLRAYVQAGGIVYCSCDGNSTAFRQAMIACGKQVAGPQYPVRPLVQTSAIYTMQPWYKFQHSPGLVGISNGLRYEWIISPKDTSAVWQQRNFARKDSWELAANLYFYATGKAPLADKLQSLAVTPKLAAITRQLSVAAVQYAGNWNPEPGSWHRMAQLMPMLSDIQVVAGIQKMSQLNPAKFPLAHLTGVGDIHFSHAQRSALLRYLDHGGTLLADSGGGKTAFTNSFERMMDHLFPHAQLVQIRRHSVLYTGTIPGGARARPLIYRKFTIEKHDKPSGRPLWGIRRDGRWVVIFSPLDLTSGLLGTNTWGINGFSPATAQALARNILAYVAQRAAKPVQATTKPKPKASPTSSRSGHKGPGI